ncbi:MAG TPA: protein kinase [Thermoanaerobaculia bacterium]|nr:protein kinase [Thermoanaerobaculia bacterium]
MGFPPEKQEGAPNLSELRTATPPPDSPRPSSPFFKPGTVLDHFEIVERLGSGGFGDVYRARDTRLGRTVAIKMLPEDFARDAERRERFRLEATAASALNHPHICTIHDFIEAEGRHLIVMELVEGRTLHEILAEGPLPASRAIDLAMQIASALAEAHAAGILHRDIKGTNIVVNAKGQAKILDFGIAKRIAPESEVDQTVEQLTRAGTTLGTLTYMSPEQLLGKPIDARSDLFSLGVVLYEMVTGRLPFAGSTPVAVTDALLHAPPRAFGDAPVPDRLKAVILKLLEKDCEKRHPSAESLREELASMAEAAPSGRAPLRRSWMIAAGAVFLALAALAGWLWYRSSRARWARTTALPEIDRFVAAEDFQKAVPLIQKARAVLPGDPTLEKLWAQSTLEVSVESAPAGANISYRPYRGDPRAWTPLGRTPLVSARIPKDFYLWRVEKAGFAPAFQIEPTWLFWRTIYKISLRLDPADRVPAEMVLVPGGPYGLAIPGLDNLPEVPLDDFRIDRHEVTNEDFKKFVDGGGYQKSEYWKERFTRDGKTMRFQEAMAVFRDATGRPGPATWELGTFPKGLGRHPVAGVSWYESAAYAAFAGKSLPTIYHWNKAAQTRASRLISPESNFQGTGTLPVGDGRISGFGTTDMAGNVKEWCWNESGGGRRFILGGGFGEPTYMFIDQDAQSPWDRRSNYGFRCVQLASAPTREATARVEQVFRDFSKEKPVSDDVFRAYTGLYAYDKGELKPRVEETVLTEDWRQERVSFDAAYGGERVIAYVFLPKNQAPPYQTVVFFPGSNAIGEEKFVLSPYAEFIPRSGRALVAPIFKSTFERSDGLKDDVPQQTASFRDHMIAWEKDLSRTIDYLETRPDIRRDALGYFGLSWGSAVGPVMLAVENRFKVAILVAGGLQFEKSLPEADPINFVGRVKVPVLLLNGRYDHFFPVETAQRPFLKLLGTPESDKKVVLYETGHAPLRKDVIRESLDWMDKYLGPVKR